MKTCDDEQVVVTQCFISAGSFSGAVQSLHTYQVLSHIFRSSSTFNMKIKHPEVQIHKQHELLQILIFIWLILISSLWRSSEVKKRNSF